MQQEFSKKDKEWGSPAFSVRIDITDTERKLIFNGKCDKKTNELFLSVLKRVEERFKKTHSNIVFVHSFEEVQDEMEISFSEEQIEEIILALLSL